MLGRAPRKSVITRYYDILGVSKTASPAELKKAYRKMAMKNHPNKGGDAEKFKELVEAYEVLNNPNKRHIYDQYGEDALKEGIGGDESPNPFDIFESIFGSGGGGPCAGSGRGGWCHQRQGEDAVHELIKYSTFKNKRDVLFVKNTMDLISSFL